MPKRIGYKTYMDLVNAPLPMTTRTYAPVEHEWIIDSIKDELEINGYEIEESIFRGKDSCEQVYGYFTFRIASHTNTEEFKGVYAFHNSYDKTLKFSGSAGMLLDNGAIILCQTQTHIRKHTGSVKQAIKEKLAEQISNINVDTSSILNMQKHLSQVSINKNEYGRLIGELAIQNFLLPEQTLNALRAYGSIDLQKDKNLASLSSSVKSHLTVWDTFKLLMKSIQETTVSNWMKAHTLLYWNLFAKYDHLIEEDKFYSNNQVDLEDSITEVEAITAETELEEGFDNTTIDDPDDLINVHIEEDNEHVVDKDQIAELIKEDEAAVAEVCDDIVPHIKLPQQVDLQSIPSDVNQESLKEIEYTYLPIEDLDGLEIGEVIEVEGCIYKYLEIVDVEGDEYGKCTQMLMNDESVEELPIETDEPVNVIGVIDEIVWATPPEDPLKRRIIKEEIINVYGKDVGFTFEKVAKVYNIKLEDGSSLSLDCDYIDSM